MRRADAPSMNSGGGEWRPGDVRLWTKDELVAEIERLDGEIRRLEAWTDDRESLVAEVARLAQYSDALEDQVATIKAENLALVDAMRDARALLHKLRPRAMTAAAILGDALTTRALAMLPEDECSECGPAGGDADCPRCNP